MRRTLLTLASLAVLCGWMPAVGLGEKPKPKERLYPAGIWMGRIGRIEEDKTYCSIQVYQAYAYWTAFRSGRTLTYQSESGVTRKDGDVWLPEDVLIRLPLVPELDKHGRPLRRAPKKDPSDPHPRLPGLHGSVADLKAGQWVWIKLEQDRSGLFFAKEIFVINESSD